MTKIAFRLHHLMGRADLVNIVTEHFLEPSQDGRPGPGPIGISSITVSPRRFLQFMADVEGAKHWYALELLNADNVRPVRPISILFDRTLSDDVVMVDVEGANDR